MDLANLKAGDNCPKCSKGRKKESRKVKLELDGHASFVHNKPIKLRGWTGENGFNFFECTKCGLINY